MVRPPSEHPTELELQILKILWRQAPLPVRDIRQALAEAGRDIAHTSTITTLNTMVGKKYLKRRMRGNAWLFEPLVSRDAVRRKVLGDIVNRVFDGSAAAVMLSLFDQAAIGEDELQQLRSLINRKLEGEE